MLGEVDEYFAAQLRPGDAFVSPGDAVGFRIMAEAGVLPEEIILKKQAAAARAHLATLTDEDARRAAMAELESMVAKLAGHSAFQGAALERLKMCADCRVIDLHTNPN